MRKFAETQKLGHVEGVYIGISLRDIFLFSGPSLRLVASARNSDLDSHLCLAGSPGAGTQSGPSDRSRPQGKGPALIWRSIRIFIFHAAADFQIKMRELLRSSLLSASLPSAGGRKGNDVSKPDQIQATDPT